MGKTTIILNSLKTYLEENGYSCEISYSADFDLHRFDGMKLFLAPSSHTMENQTRNIVIKNIYEICVGVFQKSNGIEDIPVFIETVENLSFSFIGSDFGGVRCFGVDLKPLYSTDYLKTANLLTSNIILDFQEIE